MDLVHYLSYIHADSMNIAWVPVVAFDESIAYVASIASVEGTFANIYHTHEQQIWNLYKLLVLQVWEILI